MKKDHFVITESITHIANFIKQRYKEQFKKEISPIKLHKTIYFLYEYWAKEILRNIRLEEVGNIENSELGEYFHKYKDKTLFDVEFLAGGFGPYIEKVKDIPKLNKNVPTPKALQNDKTLYSWFNKILLMTFNSNDFALAEHSQKSRVWKWANKKEDRIMNNEELIREVVYG